MSLLEVKNLSVRHGGIPAVRDVSFALDEGQSLTFLGPNGAGKTSCVEAIAGLAPKSGGQVLFKGRDITKLSASAIARAGLGLVPQWRELFPTFTVEETLAAGAQAAVGRATRPLDEIFALFPVLAERKQQAAGSLSGGEQQMLTLARAFIANPSLLLLDEPSTGLAVGIVGTLIETINRIRSTGVAILVVEQNVQIARSVAKECCLLSVGELVWRGDVETALSDGELQRAYFGAH
jgi:branched-chain amino acid transport system ATP-binding protein